MKLTLPDRALSARVNVRPAQAIAVGVAGREAVRRPVRRCGVVVSSGIVTGETVDRIGDAACWIGVGPIVWQARINHKRRWSA